MKALIRDTEIYAETSWSPFTQNHLAWTHTARPDGDGYALCEDCPADAIPSDFDISETEVTIQEATEDTPAETVIRRYAVLNQDRYNARKAQEASE